MWWIYALVGVAAFIISGLFSKSKYYGKMFAREHFQTVYDKLVQAIRYAEVCNDEDPEELKPFPHNDPRSFQTEAGLSVAVSCHVEDDGSNILHISFSQAGRYTTTGVASRFGFLVITMLANNNMELMPFFSQTRVHHMVMSHKNEKLKIHEFEIAYQEYLDNYAPIPFSYEPLQFPR